MTRAGSRSIGATLLLVVAALTGCAAGPDGGAPAPSPTASASIEVGADHGKAFGKLRQALV